MICKKRMFSIYFLLPFMLKFPISPKTMLIILQFHLLFSIIRFLKKIRKLSLKLKKNYKENSIKKITFKIMKTNSIVLSIKLIKINYHLIILRSTDLVYLNGYLKINHNLLETLRKEYHLK